MAFDGAVRVKDAAGTLVLDLTPPAYEVVAVTPISRTWKRQVATSPFMDGDVEVGAVLDAATYSLVIRCLGSTWADVDVRRVDLLNAVEAASWTLEVEVEGVIETYKARRADSAAPRPTVEVLAPFLTVSLTVPVTPHGSP